MWRALRGFNPQPQTATLTTTNRNHDQPQTQKRTHNNVQACAPGEVAHDLAALSPSGDLLGNKLVAKALWGLEPLSLEVLAAAAAGAGIGAAGAPLQLPPAGARLVPQRADLFDPSTGARVAQLEAAGGAFSAYHRAWVGPTMVRCCGAHGAEQLGSETWGGFFEPLGTCSAERTLFASPASPLLQLRREPGAPSGAALGRELTVRGAGAALAQSLAAAGGQACVLNTPARCDALPTLREQRCSAADLVIDAIRAAAPAAPAGGGAGPSAAQPPLPPAAPAGGAKQKRSRKASPQPLSPPPPPTGRLRA